MRIVFQSLIGTIKTGLPPLVRLYFPQLFQSLIGTIKTPFPARLIPQNQQVSIPHRYDKNSTVTTTMSSPRVASFQSLIGTIKTSIPDVSVSCANWFQSLIGTIKTRG
ncbi:hypothetical protein B4114_3016 [Geobacillus stearothermophilus]|uniref:Uncharacterized protein n=1 Tax=Geobacillus stearothermophilus TaxID=1422 RepID=A0A150NEA7_GEOSE|nr:hypothetical protein B4114_3016 [Geobacillus stearothermophilus]